MTRSLMLLLVLATPTLASNRYCSTGHCYPQKVAVVKAVPQTIIQNQNVFYAVGQEARYAPTTSIVQAESQQIQREMQRLADRVTEFQAYSANQPQQIVLTIQAAATQQQQQPHCADGSCETDKPAFNLKQNSIIGNTCIKCHSGPNAKAGFRLDQELSCDQKLLALAKVVAGEMPPKEPLTREQTLQVVGELSELKTTDQKPPLPPQDNLPPEQQPQEPAEGEKFSGLAPEVMQQILALAKKGR